MNDIYTTAINTQRATIQWMDVLAENLTNVYSPGYRENKVNFKTKISSYIVSFLCLLISALSFIEACNYCGVLIDLKQGDLNNYSGGFRDANNKIRSFRSRKRQQLL